MKDECQICGQEHTSKECPPKPKRQSIVTHAGVHGAHSEPVKTTVELYNT